MAAQQTRDFLAVIEGLKGRKVQVALPSIGILNVKVKSVKEDAVELQGSFGRHDRHGFVRQFEHTVL